jgi:predicted nucleic acid-binding protein
MQLPACTIDSSCLIALDHLDLIPRLILLFNTVLVPKAVRSDLYRRRASKDRLRKYFEEYAFFQPCDRYDRTAVDLLLIERRVTGSRDRGEAEAVVQASEAGASVIVDDRWGRKLATSYSLDNHGTLWVLERFHDLGVLDGPNLTSSFQLLKKKRFRLPWDEVNVLLRRAGELPLER